MRGTTATTAWTNWSRIQRCEPAEVRHPATEDELAGVVKDAATRGLHVKVPGSGHSFTGIALTDGVHVHLDRYRRVLHVDRERGRVTVQAGITLRELNEELAARGLAMANLGDIADQTISGAISTGTHGTGAKLGNLATQVVGLRLVAADGSVLECSADQQPDVFGAARVGLGALGVISTVTLQCVPAFNLHALEQRERLDDLLDALDEHADGNDHFEFHWFPHTPFCQTKRNNRTDDPVSTRGRWKEWRDGVLMENVLFGGVCRVGRRFPSRIPALAGFVGSQVGKVWKVDRSDRVFASVRLVHFNEMEYAIPREHAADALRAVRDFINRGGIRTNIPIEVRWVAGDDIPLSPASGRPTAYIAVHQFWGLPYEQYFQGVENIMKERGGRPHWGKLHYQTAETLAPRYPQWEAFGAVRRRLDPDGVFANPYLDRVLGPVR